MGLRGTPNDQPSIMEEGIWSMERFELEDSAIKPAQWIAISSRTFKSVPVSHRQLAPGAYSITIDNNDDKPVFMKKDVRADDILHFKDSLSEKIAKEIDAFWKRGALFKKFGVLQRRGYLLYGPQGTGKSSIVQEIIEDVVKRNGIVLVCDNPKFFSKGIATFRQVEPTRPVVCVFEDIDAIIKRYGEDHLLSILDGADKIDSVLNIATTNYPEILDKRIISRPRRFDRVIKILAPSAKIRKEFLTMKLPKEETGKIGQWVRDTEGLSFAALTELVISVFCLGNAKDETLKILRDMENGHPNSDDFGKNKGALGFGGREDGDDDDENDVSRLAAKVVKESLGI